MLSKSLYLYLTPLCLLLISLLNLFDIFGINIFIISIILYQLFREIKFHPCSSLLILFIIYSGYFLIRIFLIDMQFFYFFNNFALNSNLINDLKWIWVLIIFIYSYLIGYKLKLNRQLVVKVYNHNFQYSSNKKFPIFLSFFLFMFSLFFFTLYVNQIGGFSSLIKNYTVENFYYVVENQKLSNYKNFTIWFLFSGLALFLSNINSESLKNIFSLKNTFKILPMIISLIIASSFTRRGMILNVLFIVFIFWNLKVKKISFTKNIIYIFLAAILLYMVFIIRSIAGGSSFVESFLLGFNRGEFFVFDQYINSIYNGEKLIGGFHYGILHLKSFFFYLFPYSEHESIGKLLVFKSIGIEEWGIPPTITGYAYLFGGFFFLPIYSFFLGYTCAMIENFTLSRINYSNIYISLYMVYICYLWIFFRNADPLIAAYATNRWLILILLSYFITFIFSNSNRRIMNEK